MAAWLLLLWFAVNGLALVGLLKYAYGGDIPMDTPKVVESEKKKTDWKQTRRNRNLDQFILVCDFYAPIEPVELLISSDFGRG